MKRIYCAAPYTKGDVGANVKRAIDVSDELANAGFAVFCPLLTHFWHLLHPHPYHFWLDQDFEWLRQCDAMVYVVGPSNGVEEEKKLARMNEIPIYEWKGKSTITDLMRDAGKQEKLTI
jgi:hypothetical protein